MPTESRTSRACVRSREPRRQRGQVLVRRRARARQGDDRRRPCLIDVADEGPGIAPEDRELIFEKFGRSSGGTAKSGTGLGLFIARSIAEAHGGTLDVDSVPERGSVFRLELPAG